MPEYFPYAETQIGDMVATFGFLENKPLVWHIPAFQLNDESPSSINNGRYVKHRGHVAGIGKPKGQDTTLASGRNTGRTFDVVSGTWKDDGIAKDGQHYRLLMPDATASVSFEVTSHSTTSQIENALIVLGRGVVPNGLTPTRSNYQCYLHLAYGAVSDYRLAFEWMSPIRLEYYDPESAAWNAVAIARDLGDFNTYLKNNGDHITIRVEADYRENALYVEIGNGAPLRHAPPIQTGQTQRVLPTPGKLRLIGQNGWVSLEYYPLRHEAVTINKGKRDFGVFLPNASKSTVIANALAQTPVDQTLAPQVTTDGKTLKVTATASLPDSGDGLGSAEAPRVSDLNVVIPASWRYDIDGEVDARTGFLPGMRVEELEVFDSISRIRSQSAMVTVNNRDGRFTGAYGHVALNLTATNVLGGPLYQRLLGVAGVGQQGIGFSRFDPARLMTLPVSDRSYVMGSRADAPVTLTEEVVLDGWCLWSAVRFLCEAGNIHPKYLQTIPLYIPPGCTEDAPYGPAGTDCPPNFPILPRGSGLNARFKYLPDRTPWSILEELVQDSADIDPFTGLPVPYYMGFDPYGNFHFEPVSFVTHDPVIVYSSNDPTGVGQIQEIAVYNSAAQMRTSLDFQGIDANTYELLYYHLPMAPQVLKTVGFNFAWLERNARYCSEDYLIYIANAASIQASIPQQVVRMRVPFQPWVHAGDVCVIVEEIALGYVGLFVIEELQSCYGLADVSGHSGYQDSYSVVTARALVNTL